MALALSVLPPTALAVYAAGADGTHVVNDLKDHDIIDENARGSIKIHKYDITSAEKEGYVFRYAENEHQTDGQDSVLNTPDGKSVVITADGKENRQAAEALRDYAITGVEFSYLRVGDVKTLSDADDDKVNGDVELVYGLDKDLMAILGLQPFDKQDAAGRAKAYIDNVNYFTSQQINDALRAGLGERQYDASYATGEEEGRGTSNSPGERLDKEAGVTVKDRLEEYITKDGAAHRAGIAMAKTDANGETGVKDLALGLYLIVETKVPENVVDVTAPWFVQVPMTTLDGEEWFYDIECYPKNQTGQPDLDKLVRNAYGTAGLNHDSAGPASYTKGEKIERGDEYSADSEIVTNDSHKDGLADWLMAPDKKGDYSYGSTVTASEGDLLDYILVSKLPRVTGTATYLQMYELIDTLSDGLHYNNDVKIAIYRDEQSAKSNDTSRAIAVWKMQDSANYNFTCSEAKGKTDGSTALHITLTPRGLNEINKNYYDGAHYMVAYYTAKVESDATTVLGDEGNPNDVTLVWKRSSEGYHNTLEDRCILYTYGIDLTKTFSDGKAKPEDYKAVQFVLYNRTEGYYVQARPSDTDGLYYVTGKAAAKGRATSFHPGPKGNLVINGLEGDDYAMTEIHTAKGYSILKEELIIEIEPAARDITASSVHHMTVREDYDEEHPKAARKLQLSDGTVLETEEEGTTDKQNMYIGELRHSVAVVDGKKADMCAYGEQNLGKAEINATSNGKAAAQSENAAVILSILNSTLFGLPQTGGAGLYTAILIGFAAVFAGSRLLDDRKKRWE